MCSAASLCSLSVERYPVNPVTVIYPSSTKAVSVSGLSSTSLGETVMRKFPGTVPTKEVRVVPKAAIRASRTPFISFIFWLGIFMFRTVFLGAPNTQFVADTAT
jgi:hypothetical protein